MCYRQTARVLSALALGLIQLSDSAQARTAAACLFSNYLPAIALVTYIHRTPDNIETTTTGTGFLIHPDGILLTAAHVLKPPSLNPTATEEVKVRIGNRTDVMDAVIQRRDTDRDIAMLSIPRELGKPWPIVPLNKSPAINPGDTLHALGYPGGFDATVTPPGIVNSLNARVNNALKPWMQTSLDLEQGMSGGPVFDSSGYVVGMSIQRHERLTDIAYVLSTQKMGDFVDTANGNTSGTELPCAEQPQRLTAEKTWHSGQSNPEPLGVNEGDGLCFLTRVWGNLSDIGPLGVFQEQGGKEYMLGSSAAESPSATQSSYGAAARCLLFPRP